MFVKFFLGFQNNYLDGKRKVFQKLPDTVQFFNFSNEQSLNIRHPGQNRNRVKKNCLKYIHLFLIIKNLFSRLSRQFVNYCWKLETRQYIIRSTEEFTKSNVSVYSIYLQSIIYQIRCEMIMLLNRLKINKQCELNNTTLAVAKSNVYYLSRMTIYCQMLT